MFHPADAALPAPFRSAAASRALVEHREHFIAGSLAETEHGAEAAVRGVRGQAAGGCEPGIRGDDAVDDRSQRQLPLAVFHAVQNALEPEIAGGAENSGGGSVRKRTPDIKKFNDIADRGAALEDDPEAFDDFGRKFR